MKKFLLNYWKSIVVIISILYLSFASPSTFSKIPTFENEDKLVHMLMYAGLCAILIFDFRLADKNNNTKSKHGYILCLIFPILLGGVVEILQPLYFAPRSASWFDFGANVSGILLSWIFMHVFENIIHKLFVRRKA